MDPNWRTPSPGGPNSWTSPRFRGAIYRPPGSHQHWSRGSPYQRSPGRLPRPHGFRHHQSPYAYSNEYSGGDFQTFSSSSSYGHGGRRGHRGFKSQQSPHYNPSPQESFFRPHFNPRPRSFMQSPQEHGQQHNRSAIEPTNIENWVSPKMWLDPWAHLTTDTTDTAQIDLNSTSNSNSTIDDNSIIDPNESGSSSFNYSSASTMLLELGDPNEIDLNDNDDNIDESKPSHTTTTTTTTTAVEGENKQDQDTTTTTTAVEGENKQDQDTTTATATGPLSVSVDNKNKAQEIPPDTTTGTNEQQSENDNSTVLSLNNEIASSNL